MSEISSSSPPTRFRQVFYVLSLAACVAVGVFLGASFERLRATQASVLPAHALSRAGQVFGQGQSPPADIAQNVDFKLFWEVWKTLQEKYYEQPLKDKDLFYGALNGLAAGTGDPYTTFFEPELATEFDQSIQGAFGGIGAEIGLKKDLLQIMAPLPDTPADRAGLKPGDVITKINGEDTTGLAVDQAVRKIRGPKGTSVTLSIYRANAKPPVFDVTITRDTIRVTSVKSKMLSGNIAYIEVNSFNADTAARLQTAVSELLARRPKGVILDLRNNPGGLLDQAQQVAALWVGDQVVVKERRQGKIFEELSGKGRARLQGLPTIVLVNQFSASASEIVAGALQDYGLAKLVGEKTFGKGSVQELETFDDGSAVKVTIAEWLTPKERTIHKTGLEPDIVVEQTPEDYEAKRDPVLDRALSVLTGSTTSTPGTSTSTHP